MRHLYRHAEQERSMNSSIVSELVNVHMSFPTTTGQNLTALEDINLQIKDNEILAVLGPSGCGKSTLVRIITGLLRPSKGEILVDDRPMQGINPYCSVVSQGVGLFPWFTVAQNVGLGLPEDKGNRKERKESIERAIHAVGLEGFEEAYPKELSGGMKQRVGIARALVMKPKVLVMDEPFSSLDPLTAETLREEVSRLWKDQSTSITSVVMVTHSISEAAAMAHRIVIMGTRPGHIRSVIDNPLPFPRDSHSPSFQKMVDLLHSIFTEALIPDDAVTSAVMGHMEEEDSIEPVPPVSPGEIVGLIDILDSGGGQADLFELSKRIGKEFGQVIQVVKAAELLDLVDTPRRSVKFTALGWKFAVADVGRRKDMYNEQMMKLKLFQMIMKSIKENGNEVSEEWMQETLSRVLPNENAQTLFDTIVSWGRFAELLGYNADTRVLYIDTPVFEDNNTRDEEEAQT